MNTKGFKRFFPHIGDILEFKRKLRGIKSTLSILKEM